MILPGSHIIQLFTVLLTAILISLFFAVLVLVGKIQGTARVVNYAGLVRGKTQLIVKLEISGTPEDALLGDMASYIEGLRFGSSELDLVRLDDADFQAKMAALSSEFDDLRNELILVRQRGYAETASSPRASISSRPATRPPTWPRSTPRSGPRPSTFWKKSSSRTSWGCCFCSVIRSSRPCGTRP